MRPVFRALLLAAALMAAAGCRQYTGVVKTSFVSQKEVEERILEDRLVARVLSRPSPEQPHIRVKAEWRFSREYKILKINSRSLEYLDFDPAVEILEVLAAPFMMMAAIPVSIVMAPIELAAGGFEKNEPEYLFIRLSRLPFTFLFPARNADTWINKRNVYGKTLKYEDEGTVEDLSPAMTESFEVGAEGADAVFDAGDGREPLRMKTDSDGVASLTISESLAEASQEGKGLGIRITFRFRNRTHEMTLEIDPETLERIYEALRLG